MEKINKCKICDINLEKQDNKIQAKSKLILEHLESIVSEQANIGEDTDVRCFDC